MPYRHGYDFYKTKSGQNIQVPGAEKQKTQYLTLYAIKKEE
jgi:hypothetical protein